MLSFKSRAVRPKHLAKPAATRRLKIQRRRILKQKRQRKLRPAPREFINLDVLTSPETAAAAVAVDLCRLFGLHGIVESENEAEEAETRENILSVRRTHTPAGGLVKAYMRYECVCVCVHVRVCERVLEECTIPTSPENM